LKTPYPDTPAPEASGPNPISKPAGNLRFF